jgi:hypothetical protein
MGCSVRVCGRGGTACAWSMIIFITVVALKTSSPVSSQ